MRSACQDRLENLAHLVSPILRGQHQRCDEPRRFRRTHRPSNQQRCVCMVTACSRILVFAPQPSTLASGLRRRSQSFWRPVSIVAPTSAPSWPMGIKRLQSRRRLTMSSSLGQFETWFTCYRALYRLCWQHRFRCDDPWFRGRVPHEGALIDCDGGKGI